MEGMMVKSEMIINQDGIWFNIEEHVINLHEINFTDSGMFMDDNYLFSWSELEDIKNKLGK